jgi:putative peptidoglycan lipid II flippase
VSSEQGTGRAPRTARLGEAAALLAASVLLSRILGYARDIVLANQVGAGTQTDAYMAAFLVPDILNHLLAAGAFSVAFIPLYTRIAQSHGEQRAERLLGTVAGTLGLVALVATSLLWLYAEPLVIFQFPRFDPEAQALTVRLMRIVLPAQIFFLTGGILRAVLMARGYFGAQAAAPILYNGCIIAGGLATGSAEGFAWGVLVGAFLGNWLIPMLHIRGEVRLRLRFAPFDPHFRTYLWIAAPLMLGLSLTTVDEWYDKWLGGLLGPGSVACLGYARRLMMAPVGVIGQAIAAALLPTLTRLWSQGKREELDRTLLATLQASVSLAVLAGAACWLLADPMVEFLFRHGRFSAEDAAKVSAILAILSFAVPGWVTQQVAVRAFYAREETWRAMILGTALALAAIPLYLALTRHYGILGLAVAGVIAMTANALVTLVWSRIRYGAPRLGAFFGTFARSLVIAVAATVVARWLAPQLLPPASGQLAALWQLVVGGGVLLAIAGVGVHLLGDAAMRKFEAQMVARVRGLLGRRS